MTDFTSAARLLGHSATVIAERYAGRGPATAAFGPPAGEPGAILDGTIADLALEVAARRLAAYRAYVGANVVAVSPALLRACELHGLDLDEQAWRMEPSGAWPRWLCGRRKWSAVRLARIAADDMWRDVAGCDREGFIHSGLVVSRGGYGRRAIGMRVFGRNVDMGAVDGGVALRTIGPAVELTVPHVFPATLLVAMGGRLLDTVVEHPLCVGLGFVIEGATERARGTTLLRMRCEPVPWRFPWARGETAATGPADPPAGGSVP